MNILDLSECCGEDKSMLTSFLREKLSSSSMPLTCTIYDMVFDRVGGLG